jgi:hypothetical protein
LQVQWQRLSLQFGDSLDYASVDLANHGHPMPVFRWNFFDALGYQNQLLLPAAVPEEVAAGKPLPGDIVRTLSGPNAQNALKITVPMSDFWTAETYPSNGLFDLMLVDGLNTTYITGTYVGDRDLYIKQEENRNLLENGTENS